MPSITDQHPCYKDMSDTWKTCRDAVVGQRAIQSGKTRYLPSLSGQDPAEYDAYLKRALWFGATGRTVEALKGLAFRRKPVLNGKVIEGYQSNITLTGKSLNGLAREVVVETITVGRGGLLVDHPPAPELAKGQSLTREQANMLNQRPYIARYAAESIINWGHSTFDGVTVLSLVVLKEPECDKKPVRYRELALEDGAYVQRVWETNKEGIQVLISEVTPQVAGAALKEIPFYFFGPDEENGAVANPPIEDMAHINISHYRNSADLENGAHVSGLPTPYVTGITEATTKLHIGSGTAWILPDPQCQAGFVQVGADGFASLEKLMDRKEQQMAAIGARLIAPEKKAAETAESAQIRRGGESSVLADMVAVLDIALTKALQMVARWSGSDEEVSYEINKDFLVSQMTAQEANVWFTMVQAGRISQETYIEALQRGEWLPESHTYEEEQERLENQGPSMIPRVSMDPNEDTE